MIDRVLLLSLVGSAVFGALLVRQLDSYHADRHGPTSPAPQKLERPVPLRSQNPKIDELVDTALSRPVFSSTRRPPERAAHDRAAGPERPNLRLTGIVIEPQRHLAIFAMENGKPLVRSEGEMIDGWRVESIAPRAVSLSGPGGMTTIEPKFDHGSGPTQAITAGSRPSRSATAGPPANSGAIPASRARIQSPESDTRANAPGARQ